MQLDANTISNVVAGVLIAHVLAMPLNLLVRHAAHLLAARAARKAYDKLRAAREAAGKHKGIAPKKIGG